MLFDPRSVASTAPGSPDAEIHRLLRHSEALRALSRRIVARAENALRQGYGARRKRPRPALSLTRGRVLPLPETEAW